MHPRYRIDDVSEIVTPALIVFRDIVAGHLRSMLEIAGDASRLRPHCKTHKTSELTQMQLDLGIGKHKAATFAEAEVLAETGVDDILLAYPLVGPNIRRAVRFVETFTDVTFSVIADHPRPIEDLGRAMADAGRCVDVLVDLDTGQHRTGVAPGPPAWELYRQIARTDGLRAGGLHVYDGHRHQTSFEERAAAVNADWKQVTALRDRLAESGWPVPRIVAGGTASFPVYAEKDDPTIELSPGTCVFNDAGYAERFPDLDFAPAALMLTRVISRPAENLLTLDLGYKAVASDPPAGRRVVFPDLPDAKQVLQNEEHLVLETPEAAAFQPGDELLAIPRHICPTSALHKQMFVVSGGEVTECWSVKARDRWLTI